MQVYFFRARKRDELIGSIRQNGWYTRVIYDVHKVTKDIKSIILDTSAGNWKANAAILLKKGVVVFLLIDEEIPEDELNKAGISGVLFADERFCSRYLELIQLEKEQPVQITATDESNKVIPLSQRLKMHDSDGIPHEAESEHQITEVMPPADVSSQQQNPDKLEPKFSGEMNKSALPSVVTVYGAKGGIGRTVFLLNLASTLAKFGLKVCVLDLDLYLGTVASTLHVHPEWTITDLVRRIHDPKLRRTCLEHSEMGFSFVAAPTSYMDISGITDGSLAEVIHFLKEDMDIVLIDTPTIFDDGLKVIMKHSDYVFLMTSDEPASMKNLRLMADELERLERPQLMTLWNRVTGHGFNLTEAKEFLPWPTLFSLEEDAVVGNLAKRGRCIAFELPTHPYSIQLELLVRKWVGQETVEKKTWFGSLQHHLKPKWKGEK